MKTTTSVDPSQAVVDIFCFTFFFFFFFFNGLRTFIVSIIFHLFSNLCLPLRESERKRTPNKMAPSATAAYNTNLRAPIETRVGDRPTSRPHAV